MRLIGRLARLLRSTSPDLRGALAVVAVVLLVGVPLGTSALVDLDGAWVIALLIGAVLLTQLLVLLGLARLSTSIGQLQHTSDGVVAQVTDLGAEAERVAAATAATAASVEELGKGQAVHLDAYRKGQLILKRLISRESQASTRQVQALHQLLDLVRPERALPPLGGWAASPDLALHVVQHLLDHRPAVVVECGSGASTLLMALAIRRHALPTRIVSLDHDAGYAEATRRLLAENGVDGIAEVRTAALAPAPLEGHSTPWYDVAAIAELPPIDLLLVDGPPKDTGPDSRYPAVPLLRDRLAPGATVLLDDFGRPEEKAVVERWMDEVPGSVLTSVALQKGLAVLTLPGAATTRDTAAGHREAPAS